MDDSLRTPVLDNHPYHGFKPLKTIWIVCFLISLMLLAELITLFYVFVWTTSEVRCDLFYLLVYTQVSIWTIYFIIRFYISWQHKVYLMSKGYFEFYESCSKYIEIPYYVSCVWLCVTTVITCLYIEYETPHDFYCDTSYLYSPIVVVTIIMTLQSAILISLFSIYIMKVYEFNKRQSAPDAENGNQWMPSGLRENISAGDTGFRERCETIDNMLEKQADLIRYYKDANEVLNKKVFDMTSQLRTALDPSSSHLS